MCYGACVSVDGRALSQAQDSVSSNLTLGTNSNAVVAQLWQRQYVEDVYSAGSNPAHGTIYFCRYAPDRR